MLISVEYYKSSFYLRFTDKKKYDTGNYLKAIGLAFNEYYRKGYTITNMRNLEENKIK